jgi:N-acetylglucosaminyldiphosphoundecaprenol N-acetyl-beta-D-mannosaminyltransferase
MRINLFGISVSKINLKETLQLLSKYNYSETNYICLPDLSVIIAAQKDKKLAQILNNSFLTLPDGKPLEFMGKIKGGRGISTVSGYWLIKKLLVSDLKHYFYGGSIENTQLMVEKLKIEFKESRIIGFASPPLLNLYEIEKNASILRDIDRINALQPDIIWVGISSPKQDYLLYHYNKQLNHGIMIGVGGVFDYLSGATKKSPEWIKKIGLRWLYRLLQEPQRLWKKYFFAFLGLFILVTKMILLNIYSTFKRIFIFSK